MHDLMRGPVNDERMMCQGGFIHQYDEAIQSTVNAEFVDATRLLGPR
jgi:hypothetical protein